MVDSIYVHVMSILSNVDFAKSTFQNVYFEKSTFRNVDFQNQRFYKLNLGLYVDFTKSTFFMSIL